jgi:hypothetical protein
MFKSSGRCLRPGLFTSIFFKGFPLLSLTEFSLGIFIDKRILNETGKKQAEFVPEMPDV